MLDGLTNQLLLKNDTIALHKRLNGRLTIAEAVVENRSFLCATTLEDILAESGSRLLIEDGASLLFSSQEDTECVSIKYLRPLISIITGSITAREDMSECRLHLRTGNNRHDSYLCHSLIAKGKYCILNRHSFRSLKR